MVAPSSWLLTEMPRSVLFGEASEIVAWSRENDKAIPSLLDLGVARNHVRSNRKAKRGRK